MLGAMSKFASYVYMYACVSTYMCCVCMCAPVLLLELLCMSVCVCVCVCVHVCVHACYVIILLSIYACKTQGPPVQIFV